LTYFPFRVTKEAPEAGHSHINAVRFEGGLFNDRPI
jgi:hypothetical protein